jgi:hypothetical protein
MQNASKSPMILSFWKGRCQFFLSILGRGRGVVSVFSFLFWVMGVFLCHDKPLLFLCNVQGSCKDPKLVIFISLKQAWLSFLILLATILDFHIWQWKGDDMKNKCKRVTTRNFKVKNLNLFPQQEEHLHQCSVCDPGQLFWHWSFSY